MLFDYFSLISQQFGICFHEWKFSINICTSKHLKLFQIFKTVVHTDSKFELKNQGGYSQNFFYANS